MAHSTAPFSTWLAPCLPKFPALFMLAMVNKGKRHLIKERSGTSLIFDLISLNNEVFATKLCGMFIFGIWMQKQYTIDSIDFTATFKDSQVNLVFELINTN